MAGRRSAVPALMGLFGAAIALGSPTATADTLSFADGSSTRTGVDILKVRVRHEERLTVTVKHEDISRGDPADVTLWIDSRPGRDGAEFVYNAGISGESDYYLWRANGWRAAGSEPLTCWYGLEVDYTADRTKIPIGRRCLGDAERVRVSVRAALWQGGNEWSRDWAPDRHEWSRWVNRG